MSIDEDLHSRQLAVYGRQAMGKLSSAKVLVSGLNGLGAEIAKNIILAQLGHVTLHDEAAACAADLGAHFYLDEGDVGAAKNRAAACVARLQELNPTVKVHASSAALSETLVWAHDIVVLVGHSRAVAEQVSAWSRERKPAPARVIWTSVNGLFGFVCNDFGAEFVVNDATGENPRTAIVASIVQNETETLVSCVDDERIDFEEGDIVRLHEVEGMHGVHDVDFVVKDVQKSSFKIGPTTQFAPYVSGGTVVQQKQPKLLQFASIADAFRAPKGELLETDFAKFGRARLLLLAYEALEALRDENAQALPALNDVAAAKRIVELAAELNAKRAEADRVDGLADAANVAIVQQLALTARAVLNPMAAFFGGIAGQEVVKAATGKFHPIHQWLLFESLESAPDFNIEARADFVAPASSRYTDQIAVFGNSLQAKLADLKLFMVGAGALGCEFLKNFALMGIATGAAGLVTLTDDDSIEKSNLSRQFLFRNSDVGKSKSDAAATAAKKMNGAIKLKPMQDRVSPNTENVFNDEFWKGLSLVCNALDNIQARLYVDRRCVFFNKALLESGTLGTKCNTQVVIPNLTENYGASRDPEEKMTPDCVPEDHEILTNRGFMDLDTYLANRDDESLLVASFDVATQALVFERPLGAVVKERAVHRMVEFTSSKEARHTWADTAGEYGRVLSESPKRAADERSNGVSVLVTRGHEMYVQHGDWSVRDGRKQQSAVPYEKVKASTLVDSDADTFNAVRQMAVAPAGVAQPAAPLPFAAQLRLDTPARAERFLELYGFWLGDGSAHCNKSGRIESVRFAQVKPDDLAFLRESFVLLGVNYSEDKPNSKGEVAMYVRDAAWVQLFAAEHGQDSPKCFAAWVWSLDTASLRVVLRGLRRADGSRAAAIYTSSARFRDEIVRVCLMAGYTARFRCHNRAGQINGNGKPAVATWRVVFAEPDSISGKTECFPTLFKERGELAACKFEGRVWCFTMPSGFVWVRRAHKNAAGVVTKASRPLLLGNCTLHNFPHNIQHCLSYSRSEFIGQFTDRPSQAADWADAASPEAFLATLRAAGGANGEIAQTVEGLKGFVGALPSTFAECVAWARLLFDEYFVRKVRQLTHLYPADATTKSGLPFWSPPKRFPVAEEFNADDELHLLFIQSAAALRAVTSGINVPDAERRNLAHVKELVSKVVLAPWAPSDNIKIKLDEKNGGEPDNAAAAAAPDSTDEAQLLAALRALPSGAALASRTFQAQEFEKDDATNFHMDFIHAGANLRARNYKIKGVDALQSKLIAGRIIPAIATTTASATGLVCLELYKQVQAKKLEAFRNAFVNLALPVFQLIEPMPPAKIKSRTERRRPDPINHPDYVEEEEVVAYPDPHTVWDHLVVDEGDITVQEFIDFFAKKHSWTVNSIALPVIVDKKETAAMVYNSFTASTKARLPQKFSAVYEKMSKVPLGDRKYFIPSVLLEDDDGKTIETPEIIFVFRK